MVQERKDQLEKSLQEVEKKYAQVSIVYMHLTMQYWSLFIYAHFADYCCCM